MNHFMKERSQKKECLKKLVRYSPSVYSQQLALYIKTIRTSIEPLIRSLASRSPLAPSLPILSILRAVSRLLLLSPIQILLTASQLEQLEWNFNHPFVSKNAPKCWEIFWSTSDPLKCQKVTLLLLLVGCQAKLSTNSQEGFEIAEVERLCPTFNSLFEEWVELYPPSFTVSPRQLNSIFKRLSRKNAPENEFNLIVDEIVHLSHTYNIDKPSERKNYFELVSSPAQKRKYLKQQICLKAEAVPCKKRKVDFDFETPDFPQHQEESIDKLCLGEKEDVKKSQVVLNFLNASYSLSHPLANYSIQGVSQVDCDYMEVGLCEGESAQIVIMKEGLVESVFLKRVDEKEE